MKAMCILCIEVYVWSVYGVNVSVCVNLCKCRGNVSVCVCGVCVYKWGFCACKSM